MTAMLAMDLPRCDGWETPEDTGVRRRPAPPQPVPAFDVPQRTEPRRLAMGRLMRQLLEPLELPEPCRDVFDVLAAEDPPLLAAWIMLGRLERAHLAYAIEALGRELENEPSPVLTHLFGGLLAHESPLVREGTIYGMAYHRGPVVDRILRRLATDDPSPGVREAASEVLED